MNAPLDQSRGSLPWYRAPVLLLALALPLLTVLAGVATYRIAAEDTGDSDPDAVRRIAQMQTANLERDERALQLGLAGDAKFDANDGRIRVHLKPGTEDVRLELRLTHATQAQFDQTILLTNMDHGIWSGSMTGPRHGNYTVSLHAIDSGWRLVGRLDARSDQTRLLPALGQGND